MRTRLHFSRFAEYRLPALFGVGVLCLLLAVAVFATSEERTLHVFPTGVVEEGWVKGDRALEQALSQNAIFSDFTSENSASLVFSRDSVRASERREKAVIESGVATEPTADETENQIEEQGNSEDQESENPETVNQETENDETENQAQTDEESAPEESVDETEQSERAEETSVGDVPAPITDTSAGAYLLDTLLGRAARAQETTDGNQESDNQEPGSDETENQETENQQSENLETGDGATENEESGNQETENEETENNETGNQEVEHQESGNEETQNETTENQRSGNQETRTDEEDVRVCTVLDIPCHTITFEGFDIGDILADHAVKGYELRLSLAARAQEGFTADKVLVRYFFRGSWHLAGELTLDRELSNFDNGGHFAFPLPNLTAWDALRDFKVELEYVRHSTGESELYLDSVWVDTTYEANATDEEVPLSENVLPELAVLEDSGRPDLLLAEDQRIELLRTDAVPGDELVVRSDHDIYDGLTTARAYVSVTNTSDRTESFTLVTRTGKQGEVVGVLERMKNVPQTNDTPEWSEVAYYCEAGWEEESGSLADAATLGDAEPTDEPDEAEDDASVGDVRAGVEPASDVVDEGAGEGVPQEEGTSVDDEAEPLENDEELAQADTEAPEDDATVEDSVDQRTDESEVTDVVPVEETETLYRCAQAGETERCSSLNGDGTNCIKAEERVGVREEVAYTHAWQPLELRERTERRSNLLSRIGLVGESGTTSVQKLPYAKESARRLTLMPRETRYFAVDLSFTVQRAGEFMVEALGEEAEAQRTMWWRSGFTRRVPITVSRAHDIADTSLPVLYRIRFDTTHQDFFERAALDGRDVRFYDSTLRLELPSREVGFRYVDSEAEYLVELGEGRDLATSSLFVYFGNGEVDERARHAAPSITDEPIEYFGLEAPLDGAALTITSERDDNALLTQAFNEPYALAHGQERDLVVDNEVRVAARGPVRVRLAEGERARGTHGFTLSLPEHTYTSDRTTLGVPEVLVERYASVTPEVVFGEVEELPVPAVGIFEPLAFADQFARVNYLRQLAGPAYHDFLESLKDFALGDEVVFKLKYRPQKWGVTRFFRGLFRERLSQVGGVRLLYAGAPVAGARFGVTYGAEGEWTLSLVEKPREMVPGKYTVELTIDELGTVYTDTFDFYWGVLVVNTPKATYAAGDEVEFHMAALDDVGDTICDAELRLLVMPPTGDAEEVFVDRQSTCGPNNVTDDPDYLAWYTPRETGRHQLLLTHVNLEGDIVHQTSDFFDVAEAGPFTIERTGATRIWPKATYRMELTVTAGQDFSGQVIEAVPKDFKLTELGAAETEVWGGAKRIVWDVALEAGEALTLSYEYDAPDVSPYVYLLGPAEVRAGEGAAWREAKAWKLASDALGEYTETYAKWSATAADTWETKDLSGAPFNVPANAILEIGLVNKSAGNERYAGVRAATSTNDRRFLIHEAEPSGTDVTMVHVQASATSSIQHYADVVADNEFILLGYWTSGTYVERWDTFDPTTINAWTNWSLTSYGVGVDDVAEVVIEQVDEADRIAGVREYGSTLNRYINTHEAESGGVDTVTMWVRATSSTTTVQYYQNNAASIRFRHVGFFSVLPEGMTYQEHFDTLSGPASPSVWTDLVVDSQGVTKNNVVTVLLGDSAEAAGLTIGARKDGSALSRTTDLHEAESAGAGAGENYATMHVQIGSAGSSTVELFTSDITNATFRLLGRWKAVNEPPETPTLYDVPFDSEKTGSSTPYFDMSATDPDGTSDIVYEIQWDDDADLDTSPVGDRTSDDESGCSPNCFENTVNGGDTSPFTEGDKVRFTIQSGLMSGTTYYWRVRAKDVGSNVYSPWTDVRSFTYVSGLEVKAWLQTGDAQFEAGELSGTETTGSGNVRIATTPPTGAMLAYGSGASTTPNVRMWDGGTWSASSSAQDVGGQISWTVLRAAPTRNEYLLGTQDLNGDVNVQVYDGNTGTWGDLFELGVNASSSGSRAFDIAYRSVSGNAVVAVCELGVDPYYAIWDGSTWTSTSTIDLSFSTGCTWASLAASPSTDEVIFVGQAHASNAGSDYEAQVLSDTLWGNSYSAGANTLGEDAFERMAVAYEDSGDEAVVAFGNGGTANFVGAVWNTNTQTWTDYTSRTTQDDFEWGELVRDDGTDNLGICYIDEDNQVHIAKWNGTSNTWDSYDAAGDQVDGGTLVSGTDYHARGVTCQFETTVGRDGYLMVPYSDTTNARYRVWDGATLSTEQTVTTIEDSWTVSSVRSGTGEILGLWRDNTNDRFDFSYWNGNSWSARVTLETSMADDTEPYGEPAMMAAQIYQESSGSIVSPIVDFDSVPARPTWGEVLWSVTEPAGGSVRLQVYYATTTAACNMLVPDGALPGNSTGFAATSTPLNISGLSTSTYNMLCLKATLTATGAESPTLDEWSISWENKPYFTQRDFQFYTNTAAYTPTDAWPLGVTDLAENAVISSSDNPPKQGDVLRLRMSVLNENVPLPAGDKAFTLQYAEGDVCSADLTWTDVAPIGSTTAAWRGYANTISDAGWYDEDWSSRIAVTLDESYVDTDLTDFPVFVDLADMGSTFWSTVASDGGDIRVTGSNGTTEVAREVVSASSTAQTGELFFKASSVSSTSDTVFYIYFGNGSASDYASTSTHGSRNVWTNGYDSVLHLHENPAGTAPQMRDATASGYNGTTGGGFIASHSVTGLFGKALNFTGGNRYVNYANSALTSYTYSGWFKTTAFTSGGASDGTGTYFVDRQVGGNPLASLKAISSNFAHQYRNNSAGSLGALQGAAVKIDGSWQYVAWGYSAGSYVFINVDASYASSSPALGTVTPDDPRLGIHQSLTTGAYNGVLDEMRISSVARSPAWLKAEYHNGAGNLVSLSGATSLGDGYTLSSTLLSASDIAQSYEEENTSADNPNTLGVDDVGEWDWVLQNNAATSSTQYCFRMIGADGVDLNKYTNYPQLITNSEPEVPVHEAPFDNVGTASTTPFFEFSATDPEGDDMHYEVQVDDDIAFGSPTLERNSLDHFSEFKNLVTPSDKSPFTNAQMVRFTPTSGLTNGTTYWWRVRARDPSGSGSWGEWSEPWSLTVMSVSATTWHQTTFNQFEQDTLESTEASSTANSVTLAAGELVGTVTSPEIAFSLGTLGNAWGEVAWTENETFGTLRVSLEYNTGASWAPIPDSALSGNAAGFAVGPVSLLGLDPATYSSIRLVARLQDASGSPQLLSWTLSWGYAVEQPTIVSLFDNEKTGTTTPSFTFYSTDPDVNDLVYEVQWSTDSTFNTGTTSRTSDAHSGFVNTASSTDTSPFFDGDMIRFSVQAGDALSNGTTYWWRVRARDPAPGSDVWSVWSTARSFTVDTTVSVSTWFQTTEEQFESATLSGLEANSSDNVVVTTVVSEAFAAYAEGLVQTPRYRLWNGLSWGSERSALNIGERIYWIKSAAGTTRDEYVIVTGGISGAVKAQVYSGTTETFGNLTSLSVMPSALRRGFDVAYESDSGDAIAAACYGTDATYSEWDGISWTATSTIDLSFTQSCEWISLASNPESDEIILSVRANPAQAPYDFEAQVWDGDNWGASTTQGAMEAADAENIGMAVEYEESGDTAVFVTSNNTNPNFHYRTWNGSWSGTSSVTTAEDLETPKIARDEGSDDLVMCFIAQNSQLYYTRWTSGAFVTPPTNISTDSNGKDGSHSFDCTFETIGARDGFIMFPYTDATNDFYRYYDTALGIQPEAALDTVQDSWSVQSVRTGDGNILSLFWDDVNTQYDFSYWNGVGPWSARQSLDTNVAALVSPIVPADMVAREYPSITSGTIVSDPIVFEDGNGPGWGSASSSDTTPGASSILYQVEWYDDGTDTWSLIPDGVLPNNASGISANTIDLSSVSYSTYDTIRLVANFTCVLAVCPTLHAWTVVWTEGLTISGTAEEYDRTTDVTTGTVAVAVNGVLQGETGTIVGGVWSIPNVTFFPGDTVQVWVTGAADGDEAVAVTKAVGAGNITGMKLYEGHVSLGADLGTTTTNAELSLYDYSASGNNEDIFFDVDAGNDLTVCATGGCTYNSLVVLPGYTYQPDVANAGNVTTHDIHVGGTLTADGNILYVSGSWNTTGTSTMGSSHVVFTATSTSETINTAGASSAGFNLVTFGQTSGHATWTLASALDVNGNLTLAYGTLEASTSNITLAGNLSLDPNSTFVKGSGTTTFDGSGIVTLTDSHTYKQDLGSVSINGSSKTVRLGSAATTTNIAVAVGNTLDVTNSNHALEVKGEFRNAGTFTSNAGTVFFTSTTTGNVIDPGPSSFANVTFNGVNGNWAFPVANITVLRDLTIANGIVTFPTGVLTVGQSLTVTGGQFVHNNGEVRMTSTAPARTVTPLNSPFFNLNFFGSGGGWSFGQANATTSNDFTISLGAVTLPSGTLYVAGDFANEAGSFSAGDGTVHLSTTGTQKTVQAFGSTFNDLRFSGTGSGALSWYDTLWEYRIPITIQESKIDGDLTNFPVYVNLADLGTTFWNEVQDTGADIRITTSDGTTELPTELVTFATSTATGELYFKANSISSTTNTVFYLYFSNDAATAYASTSPNGSQNVWTNGYDTVLHLRENPAGTAPQMKNSVADTRHGTTGDSPPSNRSVAGKFGNAFDMTGATYYLDFANSSFTSYTYSMWLKPSSFVNGAGTDGSGTYFMDRQTGSNALASLKASGGNYMHQHRDDAGGGLGGVSGGAIRTDGSWQFVAWGRNSGVNFFVHTDGTSYTATPSLGALTPEDPRVGNHQSLADPTDYNGVVDEIRIANTARTAAWLSAEYRNGATSSTFYATTTPEAYVARVFLDANAQVRGDVAIESGSVVFPTGTLTLGGSFSCDDAATFDANNGTVLFSTSSVGHTIDAGRSSFYNVQFNNAGGGWTLTDHATSTNTWSITDASSFVVQTGKTVAVGGTFVNSDPAATDWTGSTLSLNSGTSYTVGSRTQSAESYGAIIIGANTDVKLWQSSATAYTVDATGSLYSQDHAAVDGDLYIWGEYVRSSGTEHWSVATDFDGTGIAGSPRAARVRLANGASVLLSSATLAVVGTSTGTTTVANQGSGTYTLTLSSSTINAQYYDIANTGVQGLALLASTSVTSLADGAFTLGVNGGSMLTVASTTINRNAALEIQRVHFATSSGVASGYNVTATGTASSYWWFRNSSGTYDGESFDNDPVAGPGSIRWDDSGYTISVSGTVYTGEGTGAPAFCNGSTQVVRIVVNGGASSTAACAAGTGVYTVASVNFTGDAVLTAYLDTNGGARAATVSRTPSGNITGFDLYQNRVIVRHEGVDPLSITHLAYFDSDNDADVPFVASTSTATYVQRAETGLYVWQGKTFVPGGNVTLLSGGSGAAYDGLLRLASSSTFTAAGSETHSVGGGWIANSNATFTAANSTVDFTATTSGKTLAPAGSFYNATFSGSGGGWVVASSTTVANTLAMNAGTLSGTANLVVQNGTFSGNGTVNLTGGTATVGKGGSFGGSSTWTFNNLSLGDGTASTTTKTGSGNVNITGALTIAGSHTLEAGSVNWTFTGSGTVLTATGAFTAQTSTTTFAGTSGMTVPALGYNNLVLAPASGGSPTYTLSAGNLTAATLTVGDGTNAVTVQANTNDPLITLSGTFRNRTNATYQAASANDLLVAGSFINQGSFVANGGGVVMNSTDTGESVEPGTSSFHHLTFNGAGGGWTLGNATTTGNFSLAAASSYTQTPSTTLVVQGTFSNSVTDGVTAWNGTTLYLNSGTSYNANLKSSSGDTYGTLRVGANTDVKMWNSTSSVYLVDASGSLYSQDHNGADGVLYIWGDYLRSSGTEHWSYATDFDGADLTVGSLERPVSVHLAAGASTTLSGGAWNITGAAGATTTIASQGGGVYGLKVTAGTFSAQYYRIRGINAFGLEFSGSPTISSLSDGDLELAISGGTMLSVPASVITANPVKTWNRISFATSSGVTSGKNASSTGVTTSSWRFTPTLGNYYGENYDGDPGGDPGYFIWEDSNAQVTIGGNVYSNESGAVSSLCNGSSQVVRMVIQGGTPQTTSCAAGTGAYEFTGVTYTPGDSIIVFLTGTAPKAANVTVDPITSIVDMHLYESRVVVRHEDVNAITIADLATYDRDQDPDIPFDADLGSPNTLSLGAERKLIVWDSKTFTPDGNVIVLSGGSGNDYDGTLELQANARLVSSSTAQESISIGGSWLTGAGALFSAGSSTVTFTATTSGKTVSPDSSPFYNLTFNGSGGSWTFTDANATSSLDTTITAGTVTLATSTFAVGGGFVNSGTLSAASTTFRFTATTSKNVTFNGVSVGSLIFLGSGTWTMTDTNATSTGSVLISSGTVNLPTGTFAVANAFDKTGGSFTHAGTLKLYGSLAAQTLRLGGSSLANLTVSGSGSWAFADTNATTTGTTTIAQGGLTAPSGTFAIGASLTNAGTLNTNAGTLRFFATSTGRTVDTGGALLGSVVYSGAGGGWTVATSATSTGSYRLLAGAAYTQASSTRLEVQGAFENAIGGGATDWTDSTLYLNSGTTYTINSKTQGGDSYAYLTLGANTDVSMWYSSGATTTVHASSSLYSMDHAAQDGDLYVWGEYVSSGNVYWSYANDFDGTALGVSSRQVDVRIATSSSLSLTGGTLEIVGTAGATTTVAGNAGGTYTISKAGGTMNAQYYSVRNLAAAGMTISGATTVTSLSYGDLELGANSGTLLTIAAATIDQNPSKQILRMRFATTSGVATGTNVRLSGASSNYWDFTGHYGGFDGEYEDSDGVDACGSLRWDDSTCLEISQAHYRLRSDDGGEGAPTNEWFDPDWGYRKRITISNPNSAALTNYPVRLDVAYVSEMLGTYDDLRFTDDSGTTSLPYFVEATTTATATVWVKVPSVPAQSNATVFMYYDNDFAANAESGDDTFTLFDDFEDDNIAEYSGDTSYFDVVTKSGSEGRYILEAEASKVGDFTGDGIYQTATTFGQGSTLRFKQYVDSSFDDEPCTLFAVQSPGSANDNYAVCLDQYPSDKLILARDVSNNDASGVVLASSTVAWSSGWYTVTVDWQTNNTIYVSVYNSANTLVATTSATNSTYTTGGSGFSFWGQHGGWDFVAAYPYAAAQPTYSFGAAQVGGGASWLGAQDTPVSVNWNTTFRVRLGIENGGPLLLAQQFRLQYAPKTGYGTCAAVPSVDYDDVPNQAGCGVNEVCMVSSPQFTDQAPTTQHLTSASGLPFVPGYMVENPSNQGTSMTVATSTLTELEYAIQLTAFASADSYCFRATNGGVELDSYGQVAEVTGRFGPVITNWTLNNNKSIVLVEGQTTTIYATGTVSDVNGFEDVLYATSTIYRSAVGRSCAEDPNNCYQLTSLQCPLLDCAGISCTISCSFPMEYFAEPTDPGSTYAGQHWEAVAYVIDTTTDEASSTSDGVDLLTMRSIALVTSDIEYGSVDLGADTGAYNAVSTLENTGNVAIDVQLAGTDLTAGASSIPVANQKFATSSFTYSSCVICSALSGTANQFELDLDKPTSTSTPVTDDLYWGIYVPTGVAGLAHTGVTTFVATGD